MPLNKLENFIKNYEGRILYVNSNDLDATDSITNQGNSLTKPFKTIQRALLESARFSFVAGNNNDRNDRTTILVFPGEHVIDNRPGYGIRKIGTALAEAVAPDGTVTSPASDEFTLTLESNFDLTQEDNILYKFNSVNGGVILPRGTSVVGLDLRKTKIRPKYVPNPTDSDVPASSIFRITGNCFFWQFSFFDADESSLVYTNNRIFSSGSGNQSTPTFSHHKLTCFEYADGVNVPVGYEITDLDMYYAKLSNAFNEGSGRQIPAAQKWPLAPQAFSKERPEWEIVGAFGADPINIANIYSGDGATPSPIVNVTTIEDHELTAGTPIKIRGVGVNDYNITTTVQSVSGAKTFTYQLPFVRNNLNANPGGSATVTIETDTVKGSSPYIFNTSLRSVWGLNGMWADGSKASGFRSMVVAQFTGVSLQKDDRAFVKYNPITRNYSGIPITKVTGSLLSSGSSSTNNDTIYHLDSGAVYRRGWETSHIKMTNDAIIQIVSVFAIGYCKHFDAESGGDASITNSNSNFGQIALSATGFKKEAFNKDDYGYITSIITPRSVPTTEQNVDWIPIDVGLTTAVGISSHLYLFGFNTQDNVPPNLIQGYRVGARSNDKLYLTLPNGNESSANILMTDDVIIRGSTTTINGDNSGVKEYRVGTLTSAPNYDTFELTTDHKLQTGEKIIIVSETGDLPENLTEHKVYYAIKVDNSKIKVASSLTNAQNGVPLKIYGGSQIKVLSRVSDRDSGELGSPIQYDPNRNNWFVHVNDNNDLYNSIASLGVVGFEEPRTGVTFFKRIPDSRSLDEKIYKVRVVIPKEAPNGKDPQDGFVIQESSTTGAITDSDFTLSTIDTSNYNFNRNYRFISTCTESTGTVTVITELPHNLNTGDRVLIKNVKSSTNLAGVGITGFNGDFVVSSTPDVNTFTYSTTDYNSLVHNVGIFSGPTARDTTLPRFERNDLQSNFFIYRSEVISPYIYNVQDGIYHAYVLKSDNAIPDHFTDYKYNQNIVDLYPQQDRDNPDDNPSSAVSFAKRAPLGEVVTNDLKNSVTRETVDNLVKKFGVTPIVESVSPFVAGVTTITTTHNHGFNGIVGFATLTSGSGYNDGTYYGVKLLNSDDSWNGARATVVVSGTASSITSLTVTAPGSGYNDGVQLKVDGFTGSTIGITTTTISYINNNSLQVTGVGTGFDGLFRVLSVPSKNQIAIAKTSGDTVIGPTQYLLNIAPSAQVSSVVYNSTVGISTVTCLSSHGLVAGNKLRILDSSNNNLGDYLVNDVVGVHTFTVSSSVSSSASRVLKHGFSSNNLNSDIDGENLAARGVSFYANESAILINDITTDTSSGVSTFPIRTVNSGISTTNRFPLGSFIQIDNEIMRIASSTLSGSGNNEITVLRGYLGTQKETHSANSLIKKIKPLAVEFRRPSILRASGHTFEYLGFGPGNYSTGLPQIQVRTLTEREDFLSQSQEKSCGSVVYTGMNSDGDFFIGNTKYSSASGQQTTFDIPIPTITGQDPSRLSVVFDEVIVKERILVEGGRSNQILSQFDGPVTFNENIIMNDELKLNGELILSNLLKQNNTTESTSCTTGSITTKGGVGIQKNLNVCGNVSVAGTATFNGEVQFNSGLVPDSFEDAYIGSNQKPWASAWIAGIGIATEGVPGGTEVEDRTINAWTGDLVLGTVGIGTSVIIENSSLYVNNNAIIAGILTIGTQTVTINGIGNSIGFGNNPGVGHSAYIALDETGNLTFSSGNGPVKFNDDVLINGELTVVQSTWLQNNLRVAGITTISGLLDANDGATIDDVQIGISGNNEIDTSAGNLVIDSAGGTVEIDDNSTISGTLGVTGATTLSSTLTVSGLVDANGGAEIDNVRIGVANDNEIDTSAGNLTIDSAGGTTILDDDVDITGNLNISGDFTVDGVLTVGTGIVPDADEDAYLGTTALPFSELHVGELQLAVGSAGNDDNTIKTATGDLFLDSASGNTRVQDDLLVSGFFQVDNIATFQNSIILTGANAANQEFLRVTDQSGNDKFLVDSFNGNTTISGTLNSGAITSSGSITSSNGNISASNGNISASGNVTANNRLIGQLQHSITVAGSTFNNTGSVNVTLPDKTKITVVTAPAPTGFRADMDATNQSTGNTLVMRGLNGGTQLGAGGLTVYGGDVTAFAASDERLKTNILPIENALSKVCDLDGITFNWNEVAVNLDIDNPKDPSLRESGVIAQQVQKVLPEIVETRENGYLAVKYDRLVPLLIEAIKDLKHEIEELKRK
jgi:hypothetical protein